MTQSKTVSKNNEFGKVLSIDCSKRTYVIAFPRMETISFTHALFTTIKLA